MYELVSFIQRGRTRKIVLEILKEPHTPTELSHILKTHRSTVSRTISDLESKNLVKCITPSEYMCRYYQITDLGTDILNEIKKKINYLNRCICYVSF